MNVCLGYIVTFSVNTLNPFATGHTHVCDVRFETTDNYMIVHVVQRRDRSSRFSSNYEAIASELLEILMS